MEIKEIYTIEPSTGAKIPIYSMSVSAGLPVAVEGKIDEMVDINEYLIEHPATSFFARVQGESFSQIGIMNNDIIVFDTSLNPKDGMVIIALGNDGMTIKIYRNLDGTIYLQSSNHQFLPLEIPPYLEFKILGVVTKVIHSFD